MIDCHTASGRGKQCCSVAPGAQYSTGTRHARDSGRARSVRALALLAALACGALPGGASAHGWLAVPAARNLLHLGQQGFWQQMSLNRMPSVTGGVCGGLWDGDDRFSAGGPFATNTVTGTYTEGQVIDVTVNIYINHWGKFQMRLCPLSDPSTATELAELSDTCLDQHVLQLADGSGEWVFPQGTISENIIMNLQYRLPAGVTCQRCILEWRWVTGHMCQPPGMSIAYIQEHIQSYPVICQGDYFDPMMLPPEKFWNCADITIAGGSGDSTPSGVQRDAKTAVSTPARAFAADLASACSDRRPPGPFSCAQQQAFGKCDASFMDGYCKATCGKCGSAGTPSTASTGTVARYRQCGGTYGGTQCSGGDRSNSFCNDAPWPGLKCSSGKCTRVNAAYWQCS